jgi:hypothetical protein
LVICCGGDCESFLRIQSEEEERKTKRKGKRERGERWVAMGIGDKMGWA